MLNDTSSPLRQFLGSEMPNVADVRSSYRAAQPAVLSVVRPVRPDGGRPAWGTLGAAIDHRLRHALSGTNGRASGTVAAGIELARTPLVGRPAPVCQRLYAVGLELLDEIDRLIAEHRPHDRSRPVLLPSDAEDRLSRACYAAALYEEIYRSGLVWPGTPLGDADATFGLDELLAQVPAYAVDDIVTVAGMADVGLNSVRSTTGPDDVLLGPTFAGSGDVGGADADWIADGLLVDVKATSKPNTLSLVDVYQLACYALLDYDDHYEIARVGWYLARAGWFVTWDLDEFLRLLGTDCPIGDLRGCVADVVQTPDID